MELGLLLDPWDGERRRSRTGKHRGEKRKPEVDYLFDFLGTPELEEREK